jgi:hypothetical protein
VPQPPPQFASAAVGAQQVPVCDRQSRSIALSNHRALVVVAEPVVQLRQQKPMVAGAFDQKRANAPGRAPALFVPSESRAAQEPTRCIASDNTRCRSNSDGLMAVEHGGSAREHGKLARGGVRDFRALPRKLLIFGRYESYGGHGKSAMNDAMRAAAATTAMRRNCMSDHPFRAGE